MSSLSLISPPAIMGRRQAAVIFRMTLGMVAGRISMASAACTSVYYWKFAIARESMRKKR